MIQILSLVSLALVLLGVEARSSHPGDKTSPLQLDFTVSKNVGNSTAQDFWARNTLSKNKRDAFSEPILNYRDLSYQIDIFLGSDNQHNTVVLDTGSSDLWVPNTGYDPSTSETSFNTTLPFSVSYLGGASASGEFYLDTLQFDMASPILSNFQFARASADGPGILGIADRNQEASPCIYNNLPWALQAAGVTSKASYSLFLGPAGGSGSIIFGGIDTEKYTGDLKRYPIDQSTGRLAIGVQSITVGGKSFSVEAPALIDSGTTLGLLNSELMAELDAIFNTTVVNQGGLGYRYVSCDQPQDQSIDFNFGDNVISLRYSDAIVPQDNGSCLLGFAYYMDYQILGDVFLRNAYVYCDLTEQTISLAQASYSSKSNVIST